MKYVVNPIRKFYLKGIKGKINYKHEMTNSIEEIIIVPKRTDNHSRNQWLNFSNCDDNFKSEEFQKYQKYLYLCKNEYDKQIELGNSPDNFFEYIGRFITDYKNTEIALDQYEWETLSENIYIMGLDAYHLEDIKNLLNIWEFRNYYDIPIIDYNNYNFF